MKNFKALRVSEHDGEIVHQIETVTREDLHDGDVLVKVHYSSLNYKDMLAVQAKGGVIRSYPMIPGIDFAGVVEESSSDQFKEGQEVIVTGFGTVSPIREDWQNMPKCQANGLYLYLKAFL
ncbi:alcohol dehydrogenase catalytic domain-containing protein [Ignavigranum ruoffiae]